MCIQYSRCVIILIILCVIGAVGCKMWLTPFEGLTIYFLPFEVHPGYESLFTFWTYVIILQVIIQNDCAVKKIF